MKNFLDSLFTIALALLYILGVLLFVGFIVGWIGFWWYGIAESLNTWIGWSYWIIIPLMILVMLFMPLSSLLFAVIGFIGTVWTLGWPWYASLALYLPTIAVLFLSMISAVALGAFSFIMSGLNSMFTRR